MKFTIVPAQITTVEDRVAGNLSLSQLLLLSVPLFLNSLLYIVLPPFGHSSFYKIAMFILVTLITSLLSVRVKGHIFLHWLVILTRYITRPRYYLSTLDKNIEAEKDIVPVDDELELTSSSVEPAFQNILSFAEEIYISSLIEAKSERFSFINRKGSLNVQVTENVQKS